MKVYIFYSWQSRTNVEYNMKLIERAIRKAMERLHGQRKTVDYELVMNTDPSSGNTNLIEERLNKVREKCDILVADYTNTASLTLTRIKKWLKRNDLPESAINQNVLIEESEARSIIKDGRVIVVSNAAYGAYRKDIRKPFDREQYRDPLEYNCSKQENIESQVEELARKLEQPIREATKKYVEQQDTRYIPFQTMQSPHVRNILHGRFFHNDSIDALLEDIKNQDKDIRIIGFSGIGKTRIACEAFRETDNFNVFYCNCADSFDNGKELKDAFKRFIEEKPVDLTLILDNCPYTLYEELLRIKQDYTAFCRFISLSYNMRDKDNSRNGLLIKKLDINFSKSVVENMVRMRQLKEEDSTLIVKYSSGLPYMAKLLLDNNFSNEISKLPEDKIYDRILNIDENSEESKERRIVLTAISIFRSLGFFNEMEPDMKFVAKNQILCHWSKDDDYKIEEFRQTEKIYENRGIIERYGNMVTMRPLPVAIHLAGEWYHKITDASISDLCQNFGEHPNGELLVKMLSERAKLMSEFPEAQKLVYRLTSHGSPFSKLEVVFSELGSQLFQAFVEVNPVACGDALWEMVSCLTHDQQERINRKARSNILFALDHLCFNHRSFRMAMLTLAKLSLVEPETYDNNSVGLFRDRFAIMLPATEANYEERLDVLKEVKQWGEEYSSLVVKACLMALNLGSYHRMGGPEYQGAQKLHDYEPHSHGEIVTYQEQVLDILFSCCEANEEYIEKASNVFSDNIWHMLRMGYLSVARKGMEYFYSKRSDNWSEMRRALMMIVNADKGKMAKDCYSFAEEWKGKVTPTDFVSRYLNVDKDVAFDKELSWEEENELRIQRNKDLAKEFVENHFYDQETVNRLYTGERFFTAIFAQAMIDVIGDGKEDIVLFSDMSFNAMSEYIVNPDKYSLFVYFIAFIKDETIYTHIISQLLSSEKYKYLILSIVGLRLKSADDIEPLLQKVDAGVYDVKDFGWFLRYMNCMLQDRAVYIKVFNRLMDYGQDGALLSLNFVCHQLASSEASLQDLESTAVRMFKLIEINSSNIPDNYLYTSGLKHFLAKWHHPELAIAIHSKIYKVLSSVDYNDVAGLAEIYGVLLMNYRDDLWQLLKLDMSDEEKSYRWSEFLRINYIINNRTDNPPLSSLIPDNDWKEWLGSTTMNKDIASSRLLNMISWYGSDGTFKPLFVFLMENYWKDGSRFKETFTCTFHSFSFYGTGVPLFKYRIDIDKKLINFKNKSLKVWAAKDIHYWQDHIKEENLRKAHQQAMSDQRMG